MRALAHVKAYACHQSGASWLSAEPCGSHMLLAGSHILLTAFRSAYTCWCLPCCCSSRHRGLLSQPCIHLSAAMACQHCSERRRSSRQVSARAHTLRGEVDRSASTTRRKSSGRSASDEGSSSWVTPASDVPVADMAAVMNDAPSGAFLLVLQCEEALHTRCCEKPGELVHNWIPV